MRSDGRGQRHGVLLRGGPDGLARQSPGKRPDGQRRGTTIRWFFSAIWLVYLIGPVADLFKGHHGAAWIAGGVLLAVVFCAVYIFVLGTWQRHPRRANIGLAVIAALAVARVPGVRPGLDRHVDLRVRGHRIRLPGRRRALLAVAACGGCYALLSWITHVPVSTFVLELLPVVLVGWAMVGFRLQVLLMHELRQARGTVAKLAANEERLRLARDMHDLTGQSLSLITLKSELAARRIARLPRSAELDAVLSDVTDIGRVSRQTLQDIREAVSGYRRPTLAVEIITARTSIDAAGIHLDDDPALTMRSGTFDPDAEAALAWCLREAATNVIRHSGAASCRIRLTELSGEFSLEISDDGRGLTAVARAAPWALRAWPGGHRPARHVGTAVRGRRPVLGRAPPAVDGRGFRLIATVPGAPQPKPARPPSRHGGAGGR